MFNILSNSCQMNVFDIFCKKLQSEERNLRESSISADCHFRGLPFPGMEIAQNEKWLCGWFSSLDENAAVACAVSTM